MAEGAKHKRYKEAIMEFIDGKIITIQDQWSFSILGCEAEVNTHLRHSKNKKRRSHDIVATVMCYKAESLKNLWSYQGQEFKPVMLPMNPETREFARRLITHGAEEGLTLPEIIERQAKGESIGRRPPGKAPMDKESWYELVIEVRDTSQKTAAHRDEIAENGQFAIEVDIRGCPDNPNDGVLEKIITGARFIVNPEVSISHNALTNYEEQVDVIYNEMIEIILKAINRCPSKDHDRLKSHAQHLFGKHTPEGEESIKTILDNMNDAENATFYRLLCKLKELRGGSEKGQRHLDDLKAAKEVPAGQTRLDYQHP